MVEGHVQRGRAERSEYAISTGVESIFYLDNIYYVKYLSVHPHRDRRRQP
jgi:hypothetical protein